jgi:Domain of unknown function (DUF4173)
VLLAAVFVVFALRKNSLAANSKFVRFLVYAWIAQNMALVASSAQRTMTYIHDTGWTELRVSALLWMGLICFGLAAVVWRVWKNLGTVWLVNANIAAAAALLAWCCVFNLQGFVAERNVDKAIADPSFRTDYDYLEKLGSNALPAVLRLRQHLFVSEGSSVDMGTWSEKLWRAGSVQNIHSSLHNRHQNDWRSWTLRHALILTEPTP